MALPTARATAAEPEVSSLRGGIANAIWQPRTVEIWQDWHWKEYRAFKYNFHGHWNLERLGNVIFTSKTLNEAMRHAQAIEARRAETERLGAKHESAVHAPEKE